MSDAPHDEKAVEAKGRVDDDLALVRAHERRQPAALARVHQKEDGVVLNDELLELLDGNLG
jgi:hypothetical protein